MIARLRLNSIWLIDRRTTTITAQRTGPKPSGRYCDSDDDGDNLLLHPSDFMQYRLKALFWQLSVAAAIFACIGQGLMSPIIATALIYANVLISAAAISREQHCIESAARRIAYCANAIVCAASFFFCALMASGSFADITVHERNRIIAATVPALMFSIMTLGLFAFGVYRPNLSATRSRLAVGCLCAIQVVFALWLILRKQRFVLDESRSEWSVSDQLLFAVIICNIVALVLDCYRASGIRRMR